MHCKVTQEVTAVNVCHFKESCTKGHRLEGEEEVLAHMIVYAWSLSCHFRSIFARAFVSQLHDGLGKLHLKVTRPFTFLQNSAQMGNNK